MADESDSKDDGYALMATQFSESFNDVWVLDSGCSSNMCPNRDSFFSYKEVKVVSIVMADGKAFKIQEIGSIKIKT